MKYRNLYISPKYSEGEKTYYGNVSGIPEIEMIEAGNLEDFERLFHEAVDDYYFDKKHRGSRKKTGWIIALIAVVVIIVLALLTCPDKSKHSEALKDKLSSVIAGQTISKDTDDMTVLEVSLINALVGRVLDNLITVDDFGLFSVGRLTIKESENNIVSIGAFGHIFSKSKDQMRKDINESEEMKQLKGLL